MNIRINTDTSESTAVALTLTGILLTVASFWLSQKLVLSESRFWVTLQALALFTAVTLFVWQGLPQHAPRNRFGAANIITLSRAAIVCLLGGLIGHTNVDLVQAWTLFILASSVFLLDGLDGWTARRFELHSTFGFYFDMETDALHILVLSILLYECDKAGAWVLLSGLLRYGFIAAGYRWHWLRAPLPYSLRRRYIAGFQTGILVLCLAPVVTASFSSALAACGLLALGYSFAQDSLYLFRNRKALPAT